ncbi:MAG: type II toxin-antitoxin system RelE/ParE family toxin [Deltaproteobacteria bacterium]|nr:type II toxin-antitoxin system RelE/ParE family toxin [Deltaproteobacteria bacterium]
MASPDPNYLPRLKQPGPGEDFLAAVRTILESIVANPERFPVIHRQTRRALLRRFPYGLYYRIVDDQILIVACMHGRRNPRQWQSRS